VSVVHGHEEFSQRRSRHGILEEIEHRLESSDHRPLEGVLEFLLEELHDKPDDPHLVRLLALLHERNGDAEGAKRILTSAKRGSEAEAPQRSLNLHLLHARILIEAGRLSEAEEVVRHGLSTDPSSLSAINLLAKICHIQGRLTETIHLWQRIHLLSPNREGALAQLGILHRLARDDELVRMRFVAVGEDAYAKKHHGQIELESAFAKFRERDFEGALKICEQLAAKHRGQSPALYKLAVLQKAWFQERTGELESARATLQLLGRERGFEVDLDRLGYLARICERIGRPETLRQAIHIYEHFHIHYGKLSALPRLAALSAACGDSASAAGYARNYERRFARRMQRAFPAELIRGLALQYVPLPELPSLSLGNEERAAVERDLRLEPTLAGRRRLRALVAYFDGHVEKAQRYLRRLVRSRSAAARDFGYLADSCLARQQWTDARTLYSEAVGRSPSDPGLWRRLLRAPGDEVPPALAQRLRGPDFLKEARRVLHHAARVKHADPQAWEDLARLEMWAKLDHEAGQHRAKAQALREAIAATNDVGRVLVGAVYSLNGKWKGLVHEMIASREPTAAGKGGVLNPTDGVLGSATPDLLTVIRSTLVSTKDFAHYHWPHLCRDADDHYYRLKIAKDDEPSSGTSAGLPIAVAFLSLLLQKPVPKDVALTGTLICDSQGELVLRRVGDALYKVKGAYHRNLKSILLPEENREDVEGGDLVPPSVAGELVRYAARLSDAVEILWGSSVWDW